MESGSSDQARRWQGELRCAIDRVGTRAWLREGVVVDECASTQDEACARARRDGAGVCVLAMSQVAGRGRLGRVWEQSQSQSRGGREATAAPVLGLAITFALDASALGGASHDALRLPLRAGIAARDACEGALGQPLAGGGRVARGGSRVALRWPNDVVERAPAPGSSPPKRRKIAGVLIEKREGVFLLGVGVNVLQESADFPSYLAGRAASLRMLAREGGAMPRGAAGGKPEAFGSVLSPVGVAVRLIEALHGALRAPPDALARAWREHDTLIGETLTFAHDAALHTGVVESIEHDSHILIRKAGGTMVRLPALTTSLVHDEPGAALRPLHEG
jgi:biotin-(acetyl-CoA carboxylase) ligase